MASGWQRQRPEGAPAQPQGHRRVAFLPYVRIRCKSLIQKEWGFGPQSLGEHIRRRRLMLSITQEEAAASLGVNAWTVHNWETGRGSPKFAFCRPLSISSGMARSRSKKGCSPVGSSQSAPLPAGGRLIDWG
jgi:DNA-binding XRE family transcriptional regulator